MFSFVGRFRVTGLTGGLLWLGDITLRWMDMQKHDRLIEVNEM